MDTFVFRNAVSVTPSDAGAMPEVNASGIYVGGAGNVAVLMENQGSPVTFNSVPAGTTLHIKVKRVMSTGTTATNLLWLTR